jgi:hypothetical protein
MLLKKMSKLSLQRTNVSELAELGVFHSTAQMEGTP